MARAFRQIASVPGGEMPSRMKRSIISFIYKEKGVKYQIKNYRPIGVTSILFRIMAKTLVAAIRPLLTTLVTSLQAAFQDGRYIGENIQMVQDLIAYLDHKDEKGMLVFCDQDNAYPRVDWDFLQKVMKKMNIHPEFRQVLKCMYTNPETRFKVNGHIDPSPSYPKNGLIQGDPFAPIAYLLYFQTFLSLIHKPPPELPNIKGVLIPGKGGDEEHPQEIKAAAFADDVIIALHDEDQLDNFRTLLKVYEDGASALNSWGKTFAMRVGSLRNSTYLPQGWIEGTHINTTQTDIRYLGIFLGSSEYVATKWHERITKKMEARFQRWSSTCLPKTSGGRNLVIKSSVMALAWFLVQHQCPPDLDHTMDEWYLKMWGFYEGSSAGRGLARVERDRDA